jgi:glycosyltransferase involved in cell wall biosynthesis
LNLVGLVHMPLAAAAGPDSATVSALEASERRALSAAKLLVVTGRSTVHTLTKYGIQPDRVAVVEPGTDPAPRARGSGRSADSGIELLAVGSITEGKGYRLLVAALGTLANRQWRLTCAGSLLRDPAAAADVLALVRQERLDDRVSFLGEVDRPALAACYDAADVFVLATRHETYCMAVAEALAHGLPVVSTTTGAIPQLVGEPGESAAGLLVPPDDLESMTVALSRVLSDASLRAALAENAWRARLRLPDWDTSVDKMAATLQRVAR